MMQWEQVGVSPQQWHCPAVTQCFSCLLPPVTESLTDVLQNTLVNASNGTHCLLCCSDKLMLLIEPA